MISTSAGPKKYEGLSGTEIALSESQERMAVVVAACDVESSLPRPRRKPEAYEIARITDKGRMTSGMKGRLLPT